MRVAVSWVLVLLGSCYQPTVQTGLPCSALGECPEGQVCDRGTCVTTIEPDGPTDGAGDAPADAAPDASLIDATPGAPAWIETTPFPSARSFVCAAAFNGRIYATGGSFQTVPKAEVLIAPILQTGMLGPWIPGPDLPLATRWHGCAIDTANPSLYVVGSDNGNTTRDTVYRATIDPATGALGTWIPQTPLPAGRRGHGVVWSGGQLLAIAGEQSDGYNVKDTVFVAATTASGIANAGWTTTTQLLPADYVFGTALANGRIYTTGGFHGDAAVRVSTIGLTGTPGPFTTTTSLPGARERHVSVSDGSYVYVIAGETNNFGVNLSTAFRAPILASGALGTWAPLPDIPLAVVYSSAVYAGGRIYVLGGSDGTVQTARVFILQGL